MTSAPTPDYYEILGVERDATADEIRTAWRSMTRTAHPDAGGSAGMFRLIMQASETLLDPSRRADYDAGRTTTEPAGDPEEWSDESNDGGYYEDDSGWEDVTPRPAPSPPRPGPAPSPPSDRLPRQHSPVLPIATLLLLATVAVGILVATLVLSPWWMAAAVAADAAVIATRCPRKWERVVVAILAILLLAELATIHIGQRGAHMIPTEAIPLGAIATGATILVARRRRS